MRFFSLASARWVRRDLTGSTQHLPPQIGPLPGIDTFALLFLTASIWADIDGAHKNRIGCRYIHS
jgi:hypothetical protein